MKTFRSTVLVLSLALSLSGCASGMSLEQAKDGIRQLFYDYRQACDASSSQCKAYYLAHNYPGYYDYSSQVVKDALQYTSFSSSGYEDPDVTTVEEDKEWKFPTSCSLNPVQIKVGSSPKGETYTFKSGTDYVHATYLDGKWYFYQDLNFGC
jgi:uncharacterized protein YceK